MKRVSEVDFKVIKTYRREGDYANLIANSDKIQKKMEWRPKYNDLQFIYKTTYER